MFDTEGNVNLLVHSEKHGLFKVKVALAYDAAALKHFGEFAFINFPETPY